MDMTNVIFDISMSLDGYVAGPDPSDEDPLGRGGELLHEWLFATRFFHDTHGTEGGGDDNDDSRLLARTWGGIRTEVMGRGKFSGGSAVAQQYLKAGLVDEMHLHIAPVFLGGGRRLFEDHTSVTPSQLERTGFVASPSGVLHVSYLR